MKRSLIAVCLTAAMALAANAGSSGKAKHELTAEQKAVSSEVLGKYDSNKNGKLDKEERAKMSAEDKSKWEKAFPAHQKTEKETKQ